MHPLISFHRDKKNGNGEERARSKTRNWGRSCHDILITIKVFWLFLFCSLYLQVVGGGNLLELRFVCRDTSTKEEE